MNKNQNPPTIESKVHLLQILNYLPHSTILHLNCVNHSFHDTIKDFELFRGYTLKFDCGRRGSVVGKGNKLITSKGQTVSSRNNEVVINDHYKLITVTTNNKPLKQQRVRDALHAISKTSISNIYFRSYRIFQQMASNSNLSAITPIDYSNNNKLTAITEHGKNRQSKKSGPPPAPSSRSRFNSAASERSAYSASTATTPLTLKNASSGASSLATPSFTSSRTSYSSTIGQDIVELSLPSSSFNSNRSLLSMENTSSSSSKRVSSAIFSGNLAKDPQFQALLDILDEAPFESLTVGEECVSWTWENVMCVLQRFNKIAHLAVHVGFDKRKMPNIKTEQRWHDFLGINHLNVSRLQSLWCNDDFFLRCITSLSLYRNLGKELIFIENTAEPQYEKGSLLKSRVKLKAINTNTEDTDHNDEHEMLNGHYMKQKKQTNVKLCALPYIRYRCQFAPEIDLTGVEFEGAQILEISPYDAMTITVPNSVISLRIACGGNFYDEPDDYKIIMPFTNDLRELCIYNIDNLDRMEGLYHLKKLEYLVIKKRPRDKEEFKQQIMNLCKYSPIKQITFYFNGKANKSRNHHNNHSHPQQEDYWKNLNTMNVKPIKDAMNIDDHPNLINIEHAYQLPPDIQPLADQCKFSDYHIQ